MSHSLPHLTTFLPPDFLSGDMTHHFHNPYDFASSSSTESESDDDDVTGLTRPTPVLKKKMVFSGSPEFGLNRNVFGFSPTTPFCKANEDCLELIYAAPEQVAQMKMKNKNDAVFANGGLLGAPLSHHHYGGVLRENEELLRRQQFCRRVAAGGGYNCGGGPVGFRQAAWPPVVLENQCRQKPVNGLTVKPVPGGFSAGVKKECAGTGVFLPRNYPNVSPEPKKKPACSPTHMPAGVPQPNKNMYPIIPQPPQQPNIRNGFAPKYHVPPPPPPHHFNRDELAALVTARRNAVMLAQQRQSATRAEPVLPQEWTY
ncbi:hypothetical protein HanXRQr2_Chr07g0311491 [Helianthus annuus]|uniref:Uncharacterized protein n=1 Tax=Helianthus annuus TaxID=4232 RepID=A0A251UD05_HELAN|nr:uncharacterized protein LOC110868895 isoform X1 [Helianthus annuus]KAF5800040.1 hypothetical protein HanXRQr2_Chr07g0311491 [Helianthus annuus]KAJ0558448.1 hypothetical protein HanIR_Chr07g0336471 [Helianthus annuus]KAJ0906076.1 hypothetical protein HanPSC8_Chr07g0301371 [Helianthus annuus]